MGGDRSFERRQRVCVEGMAIRVAPIEYVTMMFRISGDSVDRRELERWIEAFDLREALEKARTYEVG